MRPDEPDGWERNAGEHGFNRHGFIPVGGPRFGPCHDRTLGTLLGLLAAVTVSRHLVSNDYDPMSAAAIGLYLPAGAVGYLLGMKCPPEQRAILQAAATGALTLVGFGGMGGF